MTAEPVINTRPPYYAVIFTSVRTEGDNDYAATAARVLELARQQPGFLGVENARSELGLSVSYWGSLEAIDAWREQIDHAQAKSKAGDWYSGYRVRICKVEQEYGR
ncbi:antibiotic biosynthesis monooxygenase family protein [Methylogaea oryzae]|uniref:Polysaccharide biosynthesis protein n=1 Tax=Methylogaea oryzae TaxID=1295382 RepID=A0A8D4VQ03_9GAMM|nr:antibiotic biosynthesis monooxygenase [Methylogaea oryzae]BBL71930.1 polysaccharide biosynthesis protein [Methylogaea oryzae]